MHGIYLPTDTFTNYYVYQLLYSPILFSSVMVKRFTLVGISRQMLTNSAIYVGHDITYSTRWTWLPLSDTSYSPDIVTTHGFVILPDMDYISLVEFVGAVSNRQQFADHNSRLFNISLSCIRHMLKTLSWCFYVPRWICRLPVDLSGSLTAILHYSDVHGRQSRPGQCRGWRAAIMMVKSALSLTITLTLWCCSVPVSVACVWRRPHTADVVQGSPRGRAANADPGSLHFVVYADHGFPFTDKTLPKLSSRRQDRVGAPIELTCISFINCLLCLSSPPCETWVFDLITWFASCWGWLYDDQSLNSPPVEDSEDSYMFSKRNRLLLLLVNSRRVHINHENLGRLQISTRTWHGRCLSTFYCLSQSAILLCPS